MAGEEPRSLRRLRESLANLEQLERQRRDLRERWDERCCEDYGVSTGNFGSSQDGVGMLGGGSENRGLGRTGEGQRATSPSRKSPRQCCQHLGLANRGLAAASRPSRTRSSSPFTSSRVQRAADEFSTRFQRAAEEYSTLAVQRDSALAMALEKSQDRIEVLKRERDEESALREQAYNKLAKQESEMSRIAMLMERSEAEHRSLIEERQREAAERSAEQQRESEELQRARREQREAQEQLVALQKEAQQSRCTSEEWRARFERLLSDQRQQIETLEDASSRASRDLGEQTRRAAQFGEALYTCLQERAALLHFVVDLLTALQSLFYEPTPFATVGNKAVASRASCGLPAGARARSCSVDRWHRHSGCYACSVGPGGCSAHRTSSPSGLGTRYCNGRQELRENAHDLRELAKALEGEINAASQDYTAQIQRIVSETEKSARTLGLMRGPPGAGIGDMGSGEEAGCGAGGGRSILRACLDWISQEQRRREAQGLPQDSLAPCIDWAEERSLYQATTRTMETKFEQLSKLRKVLHARPPGVRRPGPGKGYC